MTNPNTFATREEVKKLFLLEAIEHGKAIANGDHKQANKLNNKLQSIYVKTWKQNWQNIFGELINHDDENVRLWAATFSLKSTPDLAEKTLQELSELTNITGLTAQTTLRLWKEDKLDLL